MTMRTLIAAGLCLAASLPVHSQTGTFAGTVASDTAGNVVGRAQVQLPQLNRSATTNIVGQFHFDSVPAGRYAVVVRAIGFQLFVDSVDIARGAHVDGDIVLIPTAVTLETQHTTAVVAKRLPPGLDQMADRMKMHMGGHFVTDSMLRANDEKKLTYFFAGMPGVHLVLQNGGTGVTLKGRDNCNIPVYLDGALYYDGAKSATNQPPDFNAFTAFTFSGVEYYAGAATVPSQYNMTRGSDCGVILLWTRR